MTNRPPRVLAEPVSILSDRSVAVMLCPLRLCDWTSPDVRTMPLDEQDRVAARHLLDVHRDELCRLGRLARDEGLIL